MVIGRLEDKVDTLTHAFAQQMVDHNIRVNAIGPGFIEMPMNQGLSQDQEGRVMNQAISPGRPFTPTVARMSASSIGPN